VLVVDKPAGMVVHPGRPRARDTRGGDLAHAPTTAGSAGPGARDRASPRQGHVGLLVVAKTAKAYDELVAQLAARTVTRRYLAVVHGRVRANEAVVALRSGATRRTG